MNPRFYIDPETGEPHIYRRQITEHEVNEVLLHPGEDRAGRDDSRVAVGRAESGKYLKVIYVPEPAGIFVITAYELKGKPLTAFKRRRKRKGK